MDITVRHALDDALARLAAISRNPRRDAELFLMHVLDCDLAALLTHPERPLSGSESSQYESLLTRRLAAEPIQYILGEQEFFGLAIKVTPDVLIPRPETEHLIEALLARVAREARLRIVDVGTGSGAIAIALARTLPRSEVTAVDLSLAALEVARENAVRHGVEDRMQLLHSDLLHSVAGRQFDAVVSNPPYIAEGEILEPQVANYEPRAALYAGPTGLEIYERLVPQAREVLIPGGWLMMEIGHGQKTALQNLLHGWRDICFVEDLQRIPRVAIAKNPG